ncbi:MAG TPA: hypothetical protein DHW07_03710, partial [Gammaproteobacteria bacterium]|nr:hypothetical protein [Gammaproteobacteria bacterium]
AVIHLAHSGFSTSEILVIGPGQLGAGQAYGCEADAFRLNVRADLQRLWPDQPDHFPQWANAHIHDPRAKTHAGDFYRRADFSRYVSAQIRIIPGAQNLRQVCNRVIYAHPIKEGWTVICDDESRYHSTRLVLATGNPEPEWPTGIRLEDAPELVRTPWRGEWLTRIDPTAHVCLVGSGLTAMDALYGLASQHHRGPVSLLAPHGILPPEQAAWRPGKPCGWPETTQASLFFGFARRMLKDGSWEEPDWQQRFSALREGISTAWRNLPTADRLKLQRRAGWLWSLARFRASPQTVAATRQMSESGQLTIIRDRLKHLFRTRDARWQVALTGGKLLSAEVIINCTGLGRDVLIDKLMASGQLVPVGHSKSPWVSHELRVIAPDGRPHHNLFCIGPATALALGDVVGATSVATQATRLAHSLQVATGSMSD